MADNVVLTSMTCRQYFSNILTGISCSWKQQLIDALCTAYSIPTDLTCEQVHNCETLTTLSEFSSEDGQVCITYTDEHGDPFTRCFELEDSELVITADNGLFKNTPTNVQLGGPIETPSDLLHDSYIDANGFLLEMSGLTLLPNGQINFNQYGVGDYADTPVYLLGVDASGNVVETTIDDSEIVITADNGLSKDTPTNVQLGNAVAGDAPLLHDTYIDPNGFFTLWENVAVIDDSGVVGIGRYSGFGGTRLDVVDNGLAVAGRMANFSSTSTNQGILVFISGVGTMGGLFAGTVDNVAITGSSTNNTAVAANSINGAGLTATSSNTIAGSFTISPASTGTVDSILTLNRFSAGTPTNGIGGSIDMYNRNATGGSNLANRIVSKWLDATLATRTSEFSIIGIDSAVVRTVLKISGAGLFTLPVGLQNFADDAAAAVGGIPVTGLYRNGSVVQIRVT